MWAKANKKLTLHRIRCMMIMFYKFWNSLEKPLAIQYPGAEENTVITDHNKNAEPYESLRNSCQFLTKCIRGRYTDTYSFTFLLMYR
jgi:hypothetical protein